MLDAAIRLAMLLSLLGLVAALNWMRGASGTPVAFTAGALMLCGIFAGKVAKGLRLPRLTGYLLVGVLVGPYVLRFIPTEGVSGLELVKGLAVSLIALAAGAELDMGLLRRVGIKVGLSCLAICGTVFVVCFVVALVLRPLLPFMHSLTVSQSLAVCAVLASVVVSFSPTVTIAMVQEMRSHGVFTEFLMALVIVGDLIVLILFALSVGVAKASFGAGFEPLSLFGGVTWELFGSLGFGVGLGFLVLGYLRLVGRELPLFISAVCFVSAELGNHLHLSPLLISLGAGALIANLDHVQAEKMRHAIERASLPVFALFFALAGAGLHLDVLPTVGPVALALVIVRGVALNLTGRKFLPAEDPRFRRLLWMGLISQAGVTFGLAAIVGRTFPEFGKDVETLIIAIVTVHELIGPLLMRRALLQSGDAGAS
ncbi:MAG: cation:proton antiporter [Myxococcaceae bacterium]